MGESSKTPNLTLSVVIKESSKNFLLLRHLSKMELWKGRIECFKKWLELCCITKSGKVILGRSSEYCLSHIEHSILLTQH